MTNHLDLDALQEEWAVAYRNMLGRGVRELPASEAMLAVAIGTKLDLDGPRVLSRVLYLIAQQLSATADAAESVQNSEPSRQVH